MNLRAVVISSTMAGLALVLPVVFHAVGLGSKFLPMLLPLLLNGFLVPLPWALFTGAAVPLLSAFATGMPPLYPPIAVGMSIEGAALGGTAVLLRRKLPLVPSLIGAIVVGRLCGLAMMYVLASAFGLPPRLASFASLVQGVPGVILQLAVIPMVVKALARRRGPLFSHD